jgi:hypothetical protein
MAISFRGILKDGLWFQLHVLIQVSGLTLTVAGFVVAFVNIATHFKDVHQIFGTVIFALGLVQAMHGFIRPHKASKGEQTTTLRKVWEVCHKGFGRIVIVLAWVNIYLGVKLVKNFFVGVPTNLTSNIFMGMNAILIIQTALCVVLTLVSICYKTSPAIEEKEEASEVMNDTGHPSSKDLEEQQHE